MNPLPIDRRHFKNWLYRKLTCALVESWMAYGGVRNLWWDTLALSLSQGAAYGIVSALHYYSEMPPMYRSSNGIAATNTKDRHVYGVAYTELYQKCGGTCEAWATRTI